MTLATRGRRSGARRSGGTRGITTCARLRVGENPRAAGGVLGRTGEVERKPWDLLITERLDPRDGVTRLGKAPGGRSAEALYGRMLEAEPQATAERRAELHREA